MLWFFLKTLGNHPHGDKPCNLYTIPEACMCHLLLLTDNVNVRVMPTMMGSWLAMHWILNIFVLLSVAMPQDQNKTKQQKRQKVSYVQWHLLHTMYVPVIGWLLLKKLSSIK